MLVVRPHPRNTLAQFGFSFLKGENKVKTFYFLVLIIFFTANLSAQTLDTNLPQPNMTVSAVAYDAGSNTIYLGGTFTQVGGTACNHNAAIDASTGALKSWNPSLSATSASVNGIAVYGSNVFICGNGGIAEVNGSGDIIWETAITGGYTTAQTIAVSSDGDTVFVGGYDMYINSVMNSVFALSALDGSIIWSRPANNPVRSLAVCGSTLYLGGQFTTVDGVARNYLAALSTADGSLLTWNPGVNNFVYAFAIEGQTLYAGGLFTTVSGSTRNYLAAFNTSSGALLGWNPDANGGVMALAVDASTVYVAGDFSDGGSATPITTIGGADRNYVAALDPSTGNATNWNPGANSDPFAIALSPANNEVYLGGGFTTIDGASRGYFAGITDPEDISLPVQATDFLATAEAGSVALTWKTKSEVDDAGFDILREDPGTSAFRIIASYTSDHSLCGLGTSTAGKSYNYTDCHVISGDTYAYKIEEVSTSGATKDLVTLSVTVSVPKTFALLQNYPNPFNPSTTIVYQLPTDSFVRLRVYDLLGRLAATLVNAEKSPGRYEATFNGAELPSGVYFYRIQAGNYTAVKKLLLLK